MKPSKHQTADGNLVLDFYENTQQWHVVRWNYPDPQHPRRGKWEHLYKSTSYEDARRFFKEAAKEGRG